MGSVASRPSFLVRAPFLVTVGVTCNRTVIYAAGLCDGCYRKQEHLKDYKLFISEVYGIKDMDRSYLNILNFSKSECTKCKTEKRSIAFPFLTTFLSTEYGLEMKQSLIPGAGLGERKS